MLFSHVTHIDLKYEFIKCVVCDMPTHCVSNFLMMALHGYHHVAVMWPRTYILDARYSLAWPIELCRYSHSQYYSIIYILFWGVILLLYINFLTPLYLHTTHAYRHVYCGMPMLSLLVYACSQWNLKLSSYYNMIPTFSSWPICS